jgi:hypothetical protein
MPFFIGELLTLRGEGVEFAGLHDATTPPKYDFRILHLIPNITVDIVESIVVIINKMVSVELLLPYW